MADNQAYVTIYRKSGEETHSPSCMGIEVVDRAPVSQMPTQLLLTLSDNVKQRMYINPDEVEAMIISPADDPQQDRRSGVSSDMTDSGPNKVF